MVGALHAGMGALCATRLACVVYAARVSITVCARTGCRVCVRARAHMGESRGVPGRERRGGTRWLMLGVCSLVLFNVYATVQHAVSGAILGAQDYANATTEVANATDAQAATVERTAGSAIVFEWATFAVLLIALLVSTLVPVCVGVYVTGQTTPSARTETHTRAVIANVAWKSSLALFWANASVFLLALVLGCVSLISSITLLLAGARAGGLEAGPTAASGFYFALALVGVIAAVVVCAMDSIVICCTDGVMLAQGRRSAAGAASVRPIATVLPSAAAANGPTMRAHAFSPLYDSAREQEHEDNAGDALRANDGGAA